MSSLSLILAFVCATSIVVIVVGRLGFPVAPIIGSRNSGAQLSVNPYLCVWSNIAAIRFHHEIVLQS